MIAASAVTVKLTEGAAEASTAPCALCGHRFAPGDGLCRLVLIGSSEDVAGERFRGPMVDKPFCQLGCIQTIYKIAEKLGAPANARATMLAGRRQGAAVKKALVEILCSRQVCRYG